MDRYSIFDGNAAAVPAPATQASEVPAISQPSSAPSDDSRKSLTEMADRELQATLQLLAERALYIAGASGAMIALVENGHVICRASAGPAALHVGTQLQVEAGLTGESLRHKQLLRCDDAEQDPRVNQEGCRALGIRSVMAMPLVREDDEAIGVFELLADRPQAFEECDAAALARLSQLALTALDHAEAARHALDGTVVRNEEELRSQLAETSPGGPRSPVAQPSPQPQTSGATPNEPSARLAATKQCEACGFPVSSERALCLDCEAAHERDSALSATASDFASQLSTPIREESWLERNLYTVGTIVVAALTVLALWLKFH